MPRQNFDNIDYYDCSAKPNGNYIHPTDCTRFITCANGRAADMACPDCNAHDEKCAGERYLVWDDAEDVKRCEWPQFTPCVTEETLKLECYEDS